MGGQPEAPLLSVGHQDEWAEINREEAEYHRARTKALSPAERLQVGQKLSQQAFSLLAASIRAGHVPRRVPRRRRQDEAGAGSQSAGSTPTGISPAIGGK